MAKENEDRSPKAPRIAPGRERSTEDRRCQECGMKLSLYNPGPHCWQHTMGWPWRGPSAKPRF
ncbi:MAG TPA: hypothetical protein VKK30_02035 [Actinomycetota bacterium]|nr:hypothetical protein [Actinomycetota bacterium]